MAETLELQQVVCPSCKQVITSFNPFASTVECPYCHNKAFNPLITAKKVPVPERLIVFKTDEKDFEKEMVENLVNRDYVPKDIFQCINPGNVIKAYLPMYLYEGRYQSSWSCQVAFEANEVRASSDGKSVQNKTVKKFVPHTGTSQGNFAFLCLAYEGKDIPEELRSFSAQFPYNARESVEYDPALLESDSDNSLITLALDTDADLTWTKYGNELVNQIAEESAQQQLSGEEIQNFRSSNSYDLKHEGRYVMAPFWFVYYTYNNEKHYFLMDGLGESSAMSTPIDQDEVKFVEGKERIKKIIKYLWPLAFLFWYLLGFEVALGFLIIWFIGKWIGYKMLNKQIDEQLESSKAARRSVADSMS